MNLGDLSQTILRSLGTTAFDPEIPVKAESPTGAALDVDSIEFEDGAVVLKTKKG